MKVLFLLYLSFSNEFLSIKFQRMQVARFFTLLLVQVIGLYAYAFQDTSIKKAVSEKNIRFIPYPGFADAHSTWGSIGYNPATNNIYVGVTNHADNVGFYEYDPARDQMQLHGFIKDLGFLRPFQWQGKIHSKIVVGPKGEMYFSTDGGESREEYLMNHPHGYAGGFFMKWNPIEKRLTNLGMGMQYESIKDLEVDTATGLIYAVSYPQVHFLVYDPAKNQLHDAGRLGSSHVPRVLFTDRWGNCYYVDWRQRLVKYEKSTRKLVFAKQSLPAFPGTPGNSIVTGITAYAKDPTKNVIYLVTYGAKLVAFYPQENGIGRWEDLGGVFEMAKGQEWKPYVPNLNVGLNGKLYYLIGGHGNYVRKDKTVLVEFDPQERRHNVLYEFPIGVLTEATGSDIRDSEGNLYFAGRLRPNRTEYGSVPFLVKFNPQKEVK
ncbi:MAG TPA: hypothetical protein VGN63_07280 [Flavisolibacter sp.]|jgi:hypothetical protein|nr:hypothetical protein [Flavisolibacter sp.]